MLTALALRVLNHLLASEDWARQRLQPFAGQTAQVSSGSLVLALAVTPEGTFSAGDKTATATVSIALPADAPVRALTDRDGLMAAAQISGPADFAEALGFVFRNLRWDAEDDLSRLVGDIAARRMVSGGKQVLQWQREQAKNLAANLGEYFSEEVRAIARRQEIDEFCAEVAQQDEALGRLEARIAALEQKP